MHLKYVDAFYILRVNVILKLFAPVAKIWALTKSFTHKARSIVITYTAMVQIRFLCSNEAASLTPDCLCCLNAGQNIFALSLSVCSLCLMINS